MSPPQVETDLIDDKMMRETQNKGGHRNHWWIGLTPLLIQIHGALLLLLLLLVPILLQ